MKYLFILILTILLSQFIIAQSAHSMPVLLEGHAKLDCPIVESMPVDMSVEGDAIILNKGNTLVAPTEDQTILTTHCTINIRRGAIVFICVDGDYTAVYNLAEEYRQSVCVHFDDRAVFISPGKVVLTDNVRTMLHDDNKLINWRKRIIDNAMTSGWFVDIANFSITQAIEKIKVVNNLVDSTDPTSQIILNKIRISAAKNDARNIKDTL